MSTNPPATTHVNQTVTRAEAAETEAAVVWDLALAAGDGTDLTADPDKRLGFVLPPGYQFHVPDTEALGFAPRRSKAGTTIVRDEDSLIRLARELGNPMGTRVYADPVARSITAVLNDDVDVANAGWRDRRVSLALIHTPEWERWVRLNDRLMSQHEFAEHIEESLIEIVEPTSADMLELAQSLEATTEATFRQGTRLQSGARQFTYSEETQGRAGQNGELEIPTSFWLALTPWQGRSAEPYRVEARLRYRITPDGLRIGYRLMDLEGILRSAFEDVLRPIREAELPIVLGTP